MPKQTELKLTYSVGVKVNLGNYQSADAHLSEGETWDVADLDHEQIAAFSTERYLALHETLGERIEAEAKEMTSP